MGILGMKERLTELGGQLEIASDEKGTSVTAIIPAAAIRAFQEEAAS